eukprot:2412968-Rhodomonas_salina.6
MHYLRACYAKSGADLTDNAIFLCTLSLPGIDRACAASTMHMVAVRVSCSMSGTDKAYPAAKAAAATSGSGGRIARIALRGRYAMSGTDVAYAPRWGIALRVCYAMPGAHLACGLA